MIALWIVLGFGLGVLAARYRPAKRPGRGYTMQLGAAGETTVPLGEVVEALRAAALRVVPRLDGFDVIDQLDRDGTTRMAVRVADPKAVTTGAISASVASPDLPFAVALALVPLYGPLQLTLGTETYAIDGTRDRHQLVRELSKRQTAKLEALLARRRQ